LILPAKGLQVLWTTLGHLNTKSSHPKVLHTSPAYPSLALAYHDKA
jgi:hypothetical protein